jgi:hypothetical protein
VRVSWSLPVRLRGYLTWMIKSDFADDTKAIARNALVGIYPTKG